MYSFLWRRLVVANRRTSQVDRSLGISRFPFLYAGVILAAIEFLGKPGSSQSKSGFDVNGTDKE